MSLFVYCDLNASYLSMNLGDQILCEGGVVDQVSFLYIAMCNLPLYRYISVSRNAMRFLEAL